MSLPSTEQPRDIETYQIQWRGQAHQRCCGGLNRKGLRNALELALAHPCTETERSKRASPESRQAHTLPSCDMAASDELGSPGSGGSDILLACSPSPGTMSGLADPEPSGFRLIWNGLAAFPAVWR